MQINSFKLPTKLPTASSYFLKVLLLRNNLNYTLFLNLNKSYLKQLVLSVQRAQKHRPSKNAIARVKKKTSLTIWQALINILKKKQQNATQKPKRLVNNGILTNQRKLQYYTGDQANLLLQRWRSITRLRFSYIYSQAHYIKKNNNVSNPLSILQFVKLQQITSQPQNIGIRKWLFFYYLFYARTFTRLGSVPHSQNIKEALPSLKIRSGVRDQNKISLLTKITLIKKLKRDGHFGKKKTPLDLALQGARSNPRKAFIKENLHLRHYFQKIKYLIRTKRALRRFFFKVNRGKKRYAKAFVYGALFRTRLIYVLKKMHLIPETALGIICIRLGFFLVNNVVIKNIFYRLRPGDIIQVHPTIFLGVGWFQAQGANLLTNFPNILKNTEKRITPHIGGVAHKLAEKPYLHLLFKNQMHQPKSEKNTNYAWYYFITKLQQQLRFRHKYPLYAQRTVFPLYYTIFLQLVNFNFSFKALPWKIKTKLYYLGYNHNQFSLDYPQYVPQGFFRSNKRLLFSVLKVIYNFYGSQFFLTKYFIYLWSLRITSSTKMQSPYFHVNYQTLTGIILQTSTYKISKTETKLVKRLYNNFKYIL